MKRVLVLAVLLFMTSPMVVSADTSCGCGEANSVQSPRAGIACPLFEMDTDYWYCDYYETSCMDTPFGTWLAGSYNPVWFCNTSDCILLRELKRSGATKRRATVRQFDPEHTPQRAIPLPRLGAGLIPNPVVEPFQYEGQPLYVSFTNPIDNSSPVVVEVKQVTVRLKDATGKEHGFDCKRRVVAVEVDKSSLLPNAQVKPIDDIGYRAITETISCNEPNVPRVKLVPKSQPLLGPTGHVLVHLK